MEYAHPPLDERGLEEKFASTKKHIKASLLASPPVIEFQRADPAELAQFDPNTKRCTMNCGPHMKDPRTDVERKFLCDECMTISTLPSKQH